MKNAMTFFLLFFLASPKLFGQEEGVQKQSPPSLEFLLLEKVNADLNEKEVDGARWAKLLKFAYRYTYISLFERSLHGLIGQEKLGEEEKSTLKSVLENIVTKNYILPYIKVFGGHRVLTSPLIQEVFRESLKANPWLSETQEDPDLKYSYGLYMFLGLGMEKNQSKARSIFESIFKDTGHPLALNDFAWMLKRGVGGEKNPKKARELEWKNWQDNRCLLTLENLLLDFEDSEENRTKCGDILRKIGQGSRNGRTLHNYAWMLAKGRGGKGDLEKARKLYWENWRVNRYSYSLNNFAIFLNQGIGGEKDQAQAKELWWKDWQENRNAASLNNLASALERGTDGEKDQKRARELYRQNWLENHYPDSLFWLARMYETGIGGEIDLKKTRELYLEDWQENQHRIALKNYISMLREGRGGEQNLSEAQELEKLLEKSSNK